MTPHPPGADVGASALGGAAVGTARMPALVTLLLLLGLLAVTVVVTTPWDPLPPVPGGSFEAAPAQDFTAAEQAREDAFHREVRPPAYLSLAASLGAALALGLTPLGARLVEAAARPLGGGWVWQVLLGGTAVAAVLRLAALPFDARAEWVVRRYGLSTRSWPDWLADVGKGFGVHTGLLLLALLGLFALMRAMPRFWWAPAAAAGAVLVVAVSFLYPLLVEPVFNRFTSMEEGPLRTSLIEMADDDGVPVSDVLVADASRRTTTLNAYVSGFGATRRIVVYDTLLEEATDDEVRLVVAHELGHVKDRDVLHGTLLGALGVAAAICLLGAALGSRQVGWSGASSLGDVRSLALVVAAVSVLVFLAGPLTNLVSRRMEARADIHALDLTRDPESQVAMQRRLATSNLSDLDPNPLVYGMFASHPTAPERIALARDWARLHGTAVPAPRGSESE